ADSSLPMEPDRAFLLFIVLPQTTVAIVLSNGSFTYRASQVGREEIRRIVADWHAVVHRGEADDAPAEAARRSLRLAERLQLRPLLDSIPGEVRRLVIVPDDSLHGFPFAALSLGDEFLVERFELSFDFAP